MNLFCAAKVFLCKPYIYNLGRFAHHIEPFCEKIKAIEPALISNDPYAQFYFQHLQLHARYFVRIYDAVLDALFTNSARRINKLVDYGSGNGLLGAFAKYCGVEEVVLVDTDTQFNEAARKLSGLLNLRFHEVIEGTVAELTQVLPQWIPDAVAGTDVIEHIYDLESFFGLLRMLNPDMISVFTTASNPANPLKVRSLRKLQVQDEWEGSSPVHNQAMGREAHPSFRKIREDILRACNPGFTAPELERWITATRGLYQPDILRAVASMKIPQPPADPYNTCNPITGSFTERILSFAEYTRLYKMNDWQLNVLPGFYDTDKKGLKSIISHLLNAAKPVFGMRIAPFVLLVGFRKSVI
jgi:hypothetical protein